MYRKLTALVLACLLLFAAGCGGNNGENQTDSAHQSRTDSSAPHRVHRARGYRRWRSLCFLSLTCKSLTP